MFENKGTGQTSFIPKRPMPGTAMVKTKSSGPVNLLLVLAILIFLASCGAAAGVYFMKTTVQREIEGVQVAIADRERSLDRGLVERMVERDTLLKSVDTILKNHITVSKVFEALGAVTTEPVRFTSVSIERIEPGEVTVTLSGIAESFAALAYQEEVLGRVSTDRNTRVKLQEPVISDFTLGKSGSIAFGVEMKVPVDQILYVNDYDRSTSTAVAPVVVPPVINQATTSESTQGTSSAADRAINGVSNFLR